MSDIDKQSKLRESNTSDQIKTIVEDAIRKVALYFATSTDLKNINRNIRNVALPALCSQLGGKTETMEAIDKARNWMIKSGYIMISPTIKPLIDRRPDLQVDTPSSSIVTDHLSDRTSLKQSEIRRRANLNQPQR